ncbi:MAG: toll/interleukin-1 receptor domain-containing protein [Synergistaceae bacterium]|nr:toll/interleukin-1 receptor domain-containing protein [Synergistaceae bacterium]
MPVKTCSSCGNMIIDPSLHCTTCGAIPEASNVVPPEMAADVSLAARGTDRNYQYDVFICFKNSDQDGKATEDSGIATRLHDYLQSRRLRVFLSVRELEFLGKSQYTNVIDKALETSQFMIVVGCSRENLESEWVRYEWSSFLNDIRSGFKQNTEVYVLYRGMEFADLPRALRQKQAFDVDEDDAFRKVCSVIQGAMYGYAHSLPTPAAMPTKKPAGIGWNKTAATAVIAMLISVLLIGRWGYARYNENFNNRLTELRDGAYRAAEERLNRLAEEQRIAEEKRLAEERRIVEEEREAEARAAIADREASIIEDDLDKMRSATRMFATANMDRVTSSFSLTSVTPLLPYLEPKFNNPVYLVHFHGGFVWWVGFDLKAARMDDGVREKLRQRAYLVGLHAEPAPNRDSAQPYTDQDAVWMIAR